MSKIVAYTSVTLDGVMQAPGRPDEDERGGFQHGGWAIPYADPIMWEDMGKAGSVLLGRRTYEDFYGFGRSKPTIRSPTDSTTSGNT